jgi:transketolase
MSIKLAQHNVLEEVEMRKAYGDTLIELTKKNKDIFVLDSDLMVAMGTVPFSKQFPEQTVDCGIQEANMYGVAAGLSLRGQIPYAHTFGVFASRRASDQIYESICYPNLNVRIIGSDPGVTAQINGGTHMAFEDLGTMRGFPGMTVIEPTDSTVIVDMVRQLETKYGAFYLRLVRRQAIKIYEEGSMFEIGKAIPIRDGKDVTIIAMGLLVSEAINAAKMLEKEDISARVIDMFTLKPLDREAVIQAARDTGAIVTAENHNIYNGLGSAVAEVLVENIPVPMERIGVQDRFGEVGPLDYLQKVFHLTAEDIVDKAKKVIGRK